MRRVLGLVAVCVLVGCGQPAEKTAAPPAAEPTKVVEKPLGKTNTGLDIPSYDAHVRAFCMVADDQKAFCEASLASFKDKDWPNAWRGDYQGQRNVSFCLSTGCDGAVIENAVAGCAWRYVIQGSGSSLVDDTDTRNFDLYCGRLSPIEKATAVAQAEETMKAVYGRSLPKSVASL